MSNLKPYPEYKDSGVEWIGEIPEGWKVSKLKYLSTIVTGNTPPKSNVDNYKNGIYPWVKPDNLNEDYSISDTNEKLSENGVKLARIIPKGSALVCCIGTIGKIGVNKIKITTNQQINSIIFNNHQLFNSVYGLYSTISANQEFIKHANTVVVSILNKNTQENIKMPLPPLEIQRQVAGFIKSKSKEIDSLIKDKKRLINLLEEKRQAIITETVTKGLDSNVKMKDSGIEWIGEIPEHWEEVKVGHVFEITLGKMIQTIKKNESDKLVPYLKANNVQDDFINFNNVDKMFANKNEINKYKLEAGDLLVCEGGEVGRSAFVKEDLEDTIFQNALHRVHGSDKGNIEYLHYLLVIIRNTKFIEILVNKATIAHFTRDKFSSLKIPLPNIKEQIEIVDYINKIKNDINSLQKNISFQIEKLREYRESLIYEAVTGKIDLRNYEVESTNN